MNMQMAQIHIHNYRVFADLPPIRIGNLATFVGKNDSGKSCVLCALRLFFSDKSPDLADFHLTPSGSGPKRANEMEIGVAFRVSDDFQIELEDGVPTDLAIERMLDGNGQLNIVKKYNIHDSGGVSGPIYDLIVNSFDHDEFAKLFTLKEKELNALGDQYGLDFKNSGQGVTNKGKRGALRAKAAELSIEMVERHVEIPKALWGTLKKRLPTFEFFPADTKIGTGETSFQNQFNSVIEGAVLEATPQDVREKIQEAIRHGLDDELAVISDKLTNLTDVISGLNAEPDFDWKKLATFDVMGTDEFGVSVSLEQRGSGVRRLLMVANFEYRAEKASKGEALPAIYAVEEPEAFLHPGAQNLLVDAFCDLSEAGQQIIITTHSPVFAGTVPIGDLALVQRNEGHADVKQAPELDLDQLALELGVVPAHQLVGYNGCIFVEGPYDVDWLKAAAASLQQGGHIPHTLDTQRIGVVPLGGDNLKYVASCGLMKRMNQRYAVMVDGDIVTRDPIGHANIQRQCNADGSPFIVLRKRAIENYTHSTRLKSVYPTLKVPAYGDSDDVPKILCHPMRSVLGSIDKKGVKKALIPVYNQMTGQEWLDQSKYVDSQGQDKYEVLEILETFLTIAG